MGNFLKRNALNIMLILIFSIGLIVLLYPNISDYINQLNSSRAVSEYNDKVAKMDENTKKAYLEAARAYNQKLLSVSNRFKDLLEEDMEEYRSVLNVDGNGMMCYLKSEKLKINLPVYHTTEESVLREYIGHVEGSSLPVGGLATHAALSGHRGLPNAVLFTNLDKMEIGDYFSIVVLGEELLYQVDDISTVLPDDVSALRIEPDKDWVTLITCTPYGVNTHRLLVRGTRIEKEKAAEVIVAEPVHQMGITREQITLLIALIMLVLFLSVILILFIRNRRTQKKEALTRDTAKDENNIATDDSNIEEFDDGIDLW